MARLHLIVEGRTEQTFAARLLLPHLATRGVYLFPAQLAAHAKKKGQVHRGGVLSYLPFKNDIVRRLKEDAGGDCFLSTMIDSYGLPRDFPGVESASLACDPFQRVQMLESALAKDIGDPRFLPYIQLHEFEAVLLAKPAAFLKYYKNRENAVQKLKQMAKAFDSPEGINDGENTAPSKRIIAEIAEYGNDKPTAGPFIAEVISLDVIRSKCRHFNEWLKKLEQLNS